MLKLTLVQKNLSKEWNEFISDKKCSFLQSFEWGEFQEKQGKEIQRIKISDGKILAQAQIIKEKLPFFKGGFFYLPFGPCFEESLKDYEQSEILQLIKDKLRSIARKEKIFFWKIEPFFIFPKSFNFKETSKRMQPQLTTVLDLNQPEEKIFQSFSHGLRYNIKFSSRLGVKIKKTEEYNPLFYDLLKKTAKSDGFNIFPEKYFQELMKIRNKLFMPRLYLAEYQNKIIAAYLLLFFNKTVYSLHGGADPEFKKAKPQSLLHWQAIKEAKEEGFTKYDFWGIDEKKWPGITYFKKSFKGETVSYPEGGDIVFEPLKYQFYIFLKSCKNWLKKF